MGRLELRDIDKVYRSRGKPPDSARSAVAGGIRFERVESPTREQSQAAADIVFEQVQQLYHGLQRNGRRRSIRAARAARRAAREAAKGAARRPATS